VTRAPTEGFSTQVRFFSRPGYLILITKTRVKSGLSEVINLSATSMSSINNKRYTTVFACAHQVRTYVHRIKQNVSNRFNILNKIIVGVIYKMLLSLTTTEETGETKVRTDCLNFDVSQLGLPDAFCKNTGHFFNSDKSRLHS